MAMESVFAAKEVFGAFLLTYFIPFADHYSSYSVHSSRTSQNLVLHVFLCLLIAFCFPNVGLSEALTLASKFNF